MCVCLEKVPPHRKCLLGRPSICPLVSATVPGAAFMGVQVPRPPINRGPPTKSVNFFLFFAQFLMLQERQSSNGEEHGLERARFLHCVLPQFGTPCRQISAPLGASKAPPRDAECVTTIIEGEHIKEVRGQNLKCVDACQVL